MQGGSIRAVTMWLDGDLRVLIESHEKTQKALEGKLPEVTAQHLGYIGLANAGQIGGIGLFEATLFHDDVDFEYEPRFNQVLVRMRHGEILEHVPATDVVSLLLIAPSPSQSVPPPASSH